MFKVPIIPPDLRHEETITQAAYALDCLQKTISTIFGRIDKRIEKNNVKVNELQERIKKSQEKINSLQGTRKAIHIYAPARFPATNIFRDLPVTFDVDDKAELNSDSEPIKNYQIQSKIEANLPNVNEKLIFFHVRENTAKLADNFVEKERCSIKQNQNLGSMPSDLRSIPSVLLFNTDYSVYNLKEYDDETDAWKRVKLFKGKRQQQIHNQQNAIKQILEPAPHSLANRRNEKLTPSGGLKYTPKLSEAPELDLPLDLPDLPGIADDLRYESQEAKQKIAPSLALAVENLPELSDLMKDNDKSDANNDTAKGTSDVSVPPPPPPPPLPATNTAITSAPPPPPPPPPVLQEQSSRAYTDQINKAKTHSTQPGSDTRSELMAAIRNAGGIGKAHLRSTAAAPVARNNKDDVDNTNSNTIVAKTSNSRTSQGGDLMADLHNKLLMRRKGISGLKDNTENSNKNINTNNNVANTPSGNPVISRLSSLIPPPPVGAKGRSQHTAATSEEDEDDSNDTDWVD
ncbi:hypothetical protein DOY81_001401 [Sarcophaga bullata]|nr:hypothetical protein DOY81_001401 [Sarcophaga bullata]